MKGNKMITAIIHKAPPHSYAPLNEPVKMYISSKDNLPISAHRVNGGSGTIFTSKFERKAIEYTEVQS